MVFLHIIDSLAVAPYLQGKHALDVGSGAGLPGIPLAIAYPDINWTLLDKNGKKTRFLTQVIAELDLQNIKAVHHRCEDFQPHACFNSIISRAFGTLTLFVETTEHLLCPNGIFIALKGKYPQEELANIPSRFTTQHVTRLEIKGIMADRHIVCIGHKEE
jgi:16S rRNA (guanine527-N7)-methyltransferase